MADVRHNFPPFMRQFFQDMVNAPIDAHEATPAWHEQFLQRSVTYHTGDILQRGTVNFENGHNGLTPDDMVLIYCYYMMQKHASCSFRVFDVARYLFGDDAASADRIVTVDFGCGPATWAVTMAWYFVSLSGQHPPPDRIRLRYIGIEQSAAAIRSAQAMTAYPGLFHADSLRSFFAPHEVEAYTDRIGEYIDQAQIADPLIVISFSYLFSSPTLDVPALVATVRVILDRYAQHRICLIFQNPPEADNAKWVQFRASFPDLHVIRESEPGHDRVHYNDTTGRRIFYGHSSRLWFAILSNQPLADPVAAAGA